MAVPHLSLVVPGDEPDPFSRQCFDWLAEMRASRKYEPPTIEAYASTYRTFLQFLSDHNHQGLITPEIVKAFVRRTRPNGEPFAPATVDRHLSALSKLFSWLLNEDRVTKNPCAFINRPKIENRNPRPIPVPIWQRVWHSHLSCEERVWLGLGYFVGLRRSEISAMRPDIFDVDARVMNNFIRKGGGFATLPYGAMLDWVRYALPDRGTNLAEFEADLQALVQARQGQPWLFPRREVTDQAKWVNDDLDKILKRVGLEAKTFTPHAMRHSCVTNLLACGIDLAQVAALVSHSDDTTTRRYVGNAGLLEGQLQDRIRRDGHGGKGYDPNWWKR